MDFAEGLREGIAVFRKQARTGIFASRDFWRLLGVHGPDGLPWEFQVVPEMLRLRADEIFAPSRVGDESHTFFATPERRLVMRTAYCEGPGGEGQIILTLTDVSGVHRMEAEIRRKNRDLTVVNMIASSFITSREPDVVLREMLEKTLLAMDFDLGWIALWDEDIQGFGLKCYRGISMELVRRIEEGGARGIDEKITGMPEPFCLVEEVTEPFLSREGIRAYIAAPLRLENKLMGYVFLGGLAERRFEFEEISLLSLVTNQASLILDKIHLYEEATRLAMTDGLTELYNARYFYQQMENENARCDRYGLPYSVVIFDIDSFKTINDTYGHQAGDVVLREVGQTIRHSARGSDVVARYGGEEFVVLLPNTSKDAAAHQAVRSMEAVARLRLLTDYVNKGVQVSVSGGVAAFPEAGRTVKSILYAADMALYEAKRRGKRRVCCTDPEGFAEV